MPDKSLAEMVWEDLNKEVADIKSRVSTLEARTERSETASGHPTSLSASVPLAGQGAKGGDELWLSDGQKPGESVGSGTMAYYDPNTDSWIPFGIFPRSWFSFNIMSKGTIGGDPVYGTLDALQFYSQFSRQSPANDGDTIEQGFMLMAGTYTFTTLGRQDPDGGMIDWYLDNVLFASGDEYYAAATTRNVTYSHAVVVPTSGYHVLKGVVNGKNAASTDFIIRLTTLSMLPSSY